MELLRQFAADRGQRAISSLAAEIGLPASTAYRIAATFERHGFVSRLQRGRYVPGPALLELANAGGLNLVITGVGRPIIEKLARQTGCTAHLGVFEGGMVTYLLKAGHRRAGLFTREGTQLEAYCTGIGKVLLAALPEAELQDYLATGPFIRLTTNTLTDPAALRAALATVQAQGYAADNAEMDVDLRCLAIPVRDPHGRVFAAISIAARRRDGSATELSIHLDALQRAASALTRRLGW